MARIALTAVLLLAACASDPVRVEVPVVQRAVPPAELLAPIQTPGRIFTAPGAASVACLDPAGRDSLVGYVDLLRQRVSAWEGWAAP
ncbi:hypothetical protein [Azospirillum picis]|uniref:Uncharacterized protein n=1 Tax=Azospirillum picis TaxID=488438 RepID=A0ABU0MSW4_9PROT|nr:hypothetical protein [Azospirillum picis]MBP2302827.1 hypothetical protein [Azospirillum picis]MDQ0536511.1 hypothetical protein [Azospirillum picis]